MTAAERAAPRARTHQRQHSERQRRARDGRRRRPRFTGRDAEMKRMTKALGQSPGVVLVAGEARIGKSRLVREALKMIGTALPHTLVAVCPPYREPSTLGPIVDAARQAVSDGTEVGRLGLSALAGTLRPLFPEWADSLPPAPNRSRTPVPHGTV
ncbi:AAA family ATPase [Streptomyces sp. NPDC020858]|uniref:AAA family ATPase n=1 Tax=Streptomyces sp. NPDC020858 TaxID=3365097 RepID=UPI00378F8926